MTSQERSIVALLAITDEYGADWSDMERQEITARFRAVLSEIVEPDGAALVREYERGAREFAAWLKDWAHGSYERRAERFLASCSADGTTGKVEG
jgi:hypothetical protein